MNFLAAKKENNPLEREVFSGIAIIVLTGIFVLVNIFWGFIWPLYLLIFSLVFSVAFFYPRAGIYAIVFLTFVFERFFTLVPIFIGRDEYKIYPLDIILVAVLLSLISSFIFDHGKFKFAKIDFFLLGFIALAGVYFFVGIGSGSSLELAFSSFKYYAFYPLVYFMVKFLFKGKGNILCLFHFAFAGGIVLLFFIFYGLLNGEGLWTEFTPLSTSGTRILAFTHAFYLSLVLLGVSAYIFEKRHLFRPFVLNILFGIVFFWMVGIIGSLMRHIWLGMGLSAAMMFFLLSPFGKKNARQVMANYVFFIFLATAVFFYTTALFPNLDSANLIAKKFGVLSERVVSFSNATGDESFSWRGTVWKEGIKEYLKKPIFGIGLGRVIYVEIGNYRDFIEARNIHNSPLVILLQMGIFSLLFFGFFVIFHFREIFLKKNKDWMEKVLVLVLFFYLTVFLFQPYLEANMLAIFFWIVLGLITSSVAEKNVKKNYENS